MLTCFTFVVLFSKYFGFIKNVRWCVYDIYINAFFFYNITVNWQVMPPVISIINDSQVMPLVTFITVDSQVMLPVMSITADSQVMPLVMLITVDSQVIRPITPVTVDSLFMLLIMSITDD